jgi:hypothetical protein
MSYPSTSTQQKQSKSKNRTWSSPAVLLTLLAQYAIMEAPAKTFAPESIKQKLFL